MTTLVSIGPGIASDVLESVLGGIQLFDPFMPPCHLMPWACMPELPWIPDFPLPRTWVER